VGVIMLFRKTVRPFTERQIALVNTFAEQALIAMENTRLFEAEQASKRELQASLEYQTATSDVLSVISRSPNRLRPVLDTIVATATRLCQADNAGFALLEGDDLRLVAADMRDGPQKEFLINRRFGLSRGSVLGRAAYQKQLVHVPDVLADPEWKDVETQR